MRYIPVILLCVSITAYPQMNIDQALDSARNRSMGTYSYHEKFIGVRHYGAPVILTSDGGAAFFGDQGGKGLFVKLDQSGKEEWSYKIYPRFDDLESQSVAEDGNGNFYLFMLSYQYKKYRGGSERILCYNQDGVLLRDTLIGGYSSVNNPTVAYIYAMEDGTLLLRGSVATKSQEGKDPEYHYWEAILDGSGDLAAQTGEVIDWTNDNWQGRWSPD